MNRKLACCVAIALTYLTIQPVLAASRFFDPKTMMRTSEIQRGMKAVGRTVFQGNTIAEFHLEVLGVLERENLGQDLVLARVTDGPCVERQSGIIGGMSGSPVYINGRLVGAIAYGWGFTREPIAGITSIDSMLEGLETGSQAQAQWRGAKYLAREPFDLNDRRIAAAQVAFASDRRPLAGPNTVNLQPVAPLVYCSGLTKGAMARMKALMQPYGIEPLAGPGKKAEIVPTELAPGSAISVQLMTGDFEAAGIGTVTWRDGNHVLAFGHPMMQIGNVNMPMGTAWIYDFIPSYQRSNKVGSAMQTVGALRMDCPWAIGGNVGETAPMVPVDIHVTDEMRGIARAFHVDVTNERSVATDLAISAATSALESTFNTSEEGIARVRFDVEGAKGDKVGRENRYYFMGEAAPVAMGDVRDSLQLLTDNRFSPQKIKRISVQASLNRKPDAAAIEKVYAEENVARAGEKLTLHVLIRPEGKALVEKIVRLDLPIDLPKGNMRVGVSGGSDSWALRQRLGCLLPEFECLKDVIKLVQDQEDNTQLFVAAGLPTTGLSVGGTHLMQLPSAIETVISQSPRTDMTRGKSELSRAVSTDWVLIGARVFTIATANREGAKGAPVAPPKPTKEGDKQETSIFTPPAAGGVPASLWWASSAFLPARQGASPMATDTDDEAPEQAPPALPSHRRIAARIQDASIGDAKPSTGATPVEKKPEEKKDGDDKPGVGRQVQLWTQTSKDDFLSGEAKSVAVVSDGSLSLTPEWVKSGRVEQLYIWSVAVSKAGDVYAGAGGTGNIYKLTAGKLVPFFDTGEFAVHSLAVDAAGNLWAGTAPSGKVYVITPDGKGKLACQLPVSYVWALCADGKDGLYAGTGPKGLVFHIAPDGTAKRLAATSQAHVSSLLMRGETLYAGTSEKGVVYRISPDGRIEAVLDAGEANVTSLATDGADRVFAAVAPKGAIYELRPDGTSEKLYDNEKQAIMSLLWDHGSLYAGTGDSGQVVAWLGPDRTATVHEDKDAAFITCLCPDGKGGIFAGTANPGILLNARNDKAADGELKSSVFDAKRVAQWGTVDWRAETPTGTAVAVETRSGNSNDPDDGSWSGWSRAYERPGQDRVSSPTARFIQYRLRLHKPEGTDVPLVRRVSVAYLPQNQKPDVTFTAPDEGQAIHKEFEVKWKMTDPDKDTLLATLSMQKAGDKDWQTIKTDTTAESFKWDTSKLPDGIYRLRVSVSDAPSNAVGALTDEALLRTIVVDNSSPDLRVDSLPACPEPGKSYTITGRAMDTLSRIIGVEWRFDGDDTWNAAQPTDGMFDSTYEAFTFTTGPAPKDAKAIIVRAHNAAGGSTDQRIPPTAATNPAKLEDAKG